MKHPVTTLVTEMPHNRGSQLLKGMRLLCRDTTFQHRLPKPRRVVRQGSTSFQTSTRWAAGRLSLVPPTRPPRLHRWSSHQPRRTTLTGFTEGLHSAQRKADTQRGTRPPRLLHRLSRSRSPDSRNSPPLTMAGTFRRCRKLLSQRVTHRLPRPLRTSAPRTVKQSSQTLRPLCWASFGKRASSSSAPRDGSSWSSRYTAVEHLLTEVCAVSPRPYPEAEIRHVGTRA